MVGKNFLFSFFILIVCVNIIEIVASAQSTSPNVNSLIAEVMDHYQSIYRDLHRNPELSGKEVLTSQKVAAELRNLGIEVTTGVGGNGVVGILRNGTGPTILVRADMDALPVQEKTNLPYASQNPGVMHACGHDLHIASLLGTAYVMTQTKNQWRGTLVFVGQPAEETITGARAMIADGLFTRFPKPDLAIGLHVSSADLAGKLSYRAGYVMAASDSIDVEFTGRDTHGSAPHMGIDPIVMGAEYVLKMNALVAREVDPLQPAVVTVGSFHAGTRYNIVPEKSHLQLTLRTFDETVRAYLKKRINDTAMDLSHASNSPVAPIVTVAESVSATYNDPTLHEQLVPVFKKIMGESNVSERPAIMGAEDFSEYSRLGNIPGYFFFIGATNPATPTPWPVNHSAYFAPDFVPTWTAAVRSMTGALVALMPSNSSIRLPLINNLKIGGANLPPAKFTAEEVKAILPHL